MKLINIGFIILLFFIGEVQAKKQDLNQGWRFRKLGEKVWYPATVPGTVHTDLMQNGLIPDPFYRDNESKVQWVGEADWEYQMDFYLRPDFKINDPGAYLCFEGIDTYCDVYLNQQLILSANNMFRTYKIDVNGIRPGKNTLQMVFHSAQRISDSLSALSKLKRPCENNRNYTRKAQYHFGWDWAPRLITCGIWRSVSLVYGETPKAPPSKQDQVELIQQKDSIGQSFYFKVNGVPTFMKGANWVPADVFLPRITHDKYRMLLTAAKEAGFNMLRVWGGGIYEDDYFYDLCDSLGIYIWQDFMFAGAMYPGDDVSLENIKQEAIDNLLRLRTHPCIVLWCGNNEIDEAWHNWGWQKQFSVSSADSTLLWQEYQSIFHELLPSLVKQYDPGRPYVTTSPQIGWGRKESMHSGDSHYWGMWWGMQPLGIMKEKVPRFMSEYGMQALPDMKTMQEFALPEDMDTSSVVMKAHQKHPTGYKTLSAYLEMEQIPANSFESYIRATQILQARAMETAINAQLHSNGRCMGSLLWQFNDCWPVSSWSIIDYYGRKKLGYEKVKSLYLKR
ncbi:MAG: hypothetical protein JNJ58_01075 [Chitinophagaceae bacterium]|nr:hypothetical protein [Chitinophagaceae bacterium]